MKHPSLIGITKQSLSLYINTFLFFLPFFLLEALSLYLQNDTLVSISDDSLFKISDLYTLLPSIPKLIPSFLLGLVINCCVYYSAYQKFYGNKINYFDVLKNTCNRFIPYLILNVIGLSVVYVSCAIIASLQPYISWFGALILMIFIICECYFYFLSSVFVICENKGPWESLKESRRLIRGYRLELFLLFVLPVLGMIMIYYIFNEYALTLISFSFISILLVTEFDALKKIKAEKMKIVEENVLSGLPNRSELS